MEKMTPHTEHNDLKNKSTSTDGKMTYINFAKPIASEKDKIKLNECNYMSFGIGKIPEIFIDLK